MKKYFVLLSFVAICVAVMAQYQLPNPGFERWDGTGVSDEPTNWNSFATSDGNFSSLASSPHHYHRSGGRPGSKGSSYLTIYTKSILGIKANGNMTTGRIHAGSMTATSSDNYNYTMRSNGNFCQPFSGTPDSMYVWVSFYANSRTSKAQVSAILHGDCDFVSPNEEDSLSRYCGKASVQFTRTSSSATSMQWRQIKVPFVYNGSSSGSYMLVNITTNAVPGSGDKNDSLSIDDIEFIYSAWLRSIAVGGNEIDGFSKDCMDYMVHVDNIDAEVECVTEVSDASVAINRQGIDDTTALVTIDVTAEDGITVRHYTVKLTTGETGVGIFQAASDGERQALPVYPNPAANEAIAEAVGPLEIYDIRGRKLFHCEATGCTRINLSPLPAGVYIVRSGGRTARLVHTR